MAGPIYTNALIDRVRQDIAHSRMRNEQIAMLGGMNVGTSIRTPSGMGISASGGGGLNAFGGAGQNLVTISTPWGQHVTVNKGAVNKFTQLMQGLNALGYHPKSVGGYANRNIAGTNTPSFHSRGLAIDFDPTPNRGGRLGGGGAKYGYFDPNKVNALVRRLGITWGANWNNPDPMHFSIGE